MIKNYQIGGFCKFWLLNLACRWRILTIISLFEFPVFIMHSMTEWIHFIDAFTMERNQGYNKEGFAWLLWLKFIKSFSNQHKWKAFYLLLSPLTVLNILLSHCITSIKSSWCLLSDRIHMEMETQVFRLHSQTMDLVIHLRFSIPRRQCRSFFNRPQFSKLMTIL